MSVSFAFLVITSLILWFIIGSKGMWFIKATTIAVALYLCLSVSLSLKDMEGWASREEIPDKFQVHWIVVEEPDKKRNSDGAIYVWLTDLEPKDRSSWPFISFYGNRENQPRAYILAYSKEIHKDSEDALTKIRQGKQVVGRRGEGGKGEEGEGEEGVEGGKKNGDGKSGGKGGGSITRNGGISFEELPPTRLPDKGE